MMHKFDSLLSDLVRQVLWEAYSPGLVQKLRQKFKAENPALADDIIDFYIDKFDKNKDGPRIKGAGKSPISSNIISINSVMKIRMFGSNSMMQKSLKFGVMEMRPE